MDSVAIKIFTCAAGMAPRKKIVTNEISDRKDVTVTIAYYNQSNHLCFVFRPAITIRTATPQKNRELNLKKMHRIRRSFTC